MKSYERQYDDWLEEPYQEDEERLSYEDSDEWDRAFESWREEKWQQS